MAKNKSKTRERRELEQKLYEKQRARFKSFGIDPDKDNWDDISWEIARKNADKIEREKEYLNSLPEGDPPIKEQIEICMNKLQEMGEHGYQFENEISNPGRYNFTVSWNKNIIAENLPSLADVEGIVASVKRYQEFTEGLKAKGVDLRSTDKRFSGWKDDEWIGDEQFYAFEMEYKGHYFTLSCQITSQHQQECREAISLFPEEELERFTSDVDAGLPFPGYTKEGREKAQKNLAEYQKRVEDSYQGIPHDEEIEPVELNAEQKESLEKHLNNVPDECDGTLKHTVEWVIENIPEQDRAGVLETIRDGGGYCDCEVMMNYLDE